MAVAMERSSPIVLCHFFGNASLIGTDVLEDFAETIHAMVREA
jgi:hypothetical protein